MASKHLRYKDVLGLINDNKDILKRILENDTAKPHIALARKIKKGRRLKGNEFEQWAQWKGVRRTDYIRRNKEDEINAAIQVAIRDKDLERKITVLDALSGVGTPFASVILMFFDPVNYGVIDIRTHRVLCRYGEVGPGECARNFTARQYANYIKLLRVYRKRLKNKNVNLTVRKIELILWAYDRKVRSEDGVY